MKIKKSKRNLERRIKDYHMMISKSRTDNWAGYKKPGSNKK